MKENNVDIEEKDLLYISNIAYKVYKKSFLGIELNDLIQEGCLHYIKARQKYSESKNDYYMGFVYKRVYGAMLDWVAKHSVDRQASIRKSVKAPKHTTQSLDIETIETAKHTDMTANTNGEMFSEYLENQEKLLAIFNVAFTEVEKNILYDFLFEKRNGYSKYKESFKSLKDYKEYCSTLLKTFYDYIEDLELF